MKKNIIVCFVFILLTGIFQINGQGVLLPLDSTQTDFLNSYKFILESANNDYRSTNSTMDSNLFPRYGEYSLYWIASGSNKGKVLYPDILPSGYSTLNSSAYNSYNWQNNLHYSIQAKFDNKSIAIFRSDILKNGNSVSWEAVYFKNLFSTYFGDVSYYISDNEIDSLGISGQTKVLIISSFSMNGKSNQFFIDQIFTKHPGIKAKIDAFLASGGCIYAEGNASYFMEKAGYLSAGAVNFASSTAPPANLHFNININASANPVSFTANATGNYLYGASLPSINPGSADVIASLKSNSNPVIISMDGSRANGGRIIINSGLPTVGGTNLLTAGSRQLQWTLNSIMYFFSRKVDIARCSYNVLPAGIVAGKNAVAYDRLDTFEIRINLRNLSADTINNLVSNEYFQDFFSFVDVLTTGLTYSVSGKSITFTGISLMPFSDKMIIYRLRTPFQNDTVHGKIDKIIVYENLVLVTTNLTRYSDKSGINTTIKYRDFADMMFSAEIMADADLNWKNFLGLYYQPFKVFMIMENKERTSAMQTTYTQFIPKDVPFYWVDDTNDIPILRTPGGKYLAVLKGSNDQSAPAYDMDGDGKPDVWLDTSTIYPKGFTLAEDSVYWLNPWTHKYEDIDHDGKIAGDSNKDGIVDFSEPGDKIRVWKISWNIGEVRGHQFFDPYSSLEVWVDPPDLVAMAAGIGYVYGKVSKPFPGMFYPYSHISSPNLADTSWKNWMERDSNNKVVWKQLILQKKNNYSGYAFVDTSAYRLLPSDVLIGTVPQPKEAFIAVLSLGGEEIDMTHPIPQKSLYSNINYKTIFNEKRETPIRSTYTFYAPLPNPLQFEYLSSTYAITDPKTGDTINILPEWGNANITFNVTASTEYSYYWIRNAGHDVDFKDPSLAAEGIDKLGDGVFGYLMYTIPKGMGGYQINLPKLPNGKFDIPNIVEGYQKWIKNNHSRDSVEIWEDPLSYTVYIPQLLIPPALDDDNCDGIDDWIDDRGDRFQSTTGFLHDPFMAANGETYPGWPKTPFKDGDFGMVTSGWYPGSDAAYGDDDFENLGKVKFKIHAIYSGNGREGTIDISKGGILVVEEIFGGSPWVIFSHDITSFAKGIDLKLTSGPSPTLVKFGIDTSYIKHIVEDTREPHSFNSDFDPYYISNGFGDVAITAFAGGQDPCNLINPPINMPAIIDPGFHHKTITLIPLADTSNPDLKAFPKTLSGTFYEVVVELNNGTDKNFINTTVKPVISSTLKNTKLVFSYVAYPRPLVPAVADPITGQVTHKGDQIGSFLQGWRFNQPDGEVLIKLGDTLNLIQPSRKAYFVFLFSIDESLKNGVYDIGFNMNGNRENYCKKALEPFSYHVPEVQFSLTDITVKGDILSFQKFVIGKGSLVDLQTNMTDHFTGLENVKWSMQDVNNTNFPSMSKSFPAHFNALKNVETIDLSQFKNFPSADTSRFYILEQGQVNSYNNLKPATQITNSEVLNFKFEKSADSCIDKPLFVVPVGPKIIAVKSIYSINGKLIADGSNIVIPKKAGLDIVALVQVGNMGNSMATLINLKIIPGSSFVPIIDSLPPSCIYSNKIISTTISSLLPGEVVELYLHFTSQGGDCDSAKYDAEVISNIEINYKGIIFSKIETFVYKDDSLLSSPLPDYKLLSLISDKMSVKPGMDINLTAKLNAGPYSGKNVQLRITAIVNGIPTIIATKNYNPLIKLQDVIYTTKFKVPDSIVTLEFIAELDPLDSFYEYCEANNKKALSINIIGSGPWIMDVSIYPNPFSEKVEFNYTITRDMYNLVINFYDYQGKLIDKFDNLSGSIGKYKLTWQNPGIAQGIYYYQIKSSLIGSPGSYEVRGKLVKWKF